MTTDPASRRSIDFSSLDEVLRDAENLARGHTTLGNWTLGQILYHLATAIRGSRRRRPDAPTRPVDETFRRRMFESRRFPEGVPAPHPKLVPPADANAAVQLEELREAIAQWSVATGPFPDHPFMGPLSKDEWTQFHCVHSAHHLSFVVPSQDVS
jgi:hypothetical protein